MKTYQFFDVDGRLHPMRWSGPEDQLAANTPSGHTAIEGAWDYLSHRVDLTTGQVVDWQPPAPADTDLATHAWDADRRRWVASPTLKAQALAERERLIRSIESREARALRPLREAVLAVAAGQPVPPAARMALESLDAEVSGIRAALPPIPSDPQTRS